MIDTSRFIRAIRDIMVITRFIRVIRTFTRSIRVTMS